MGIYSRDYYRSDESNRSFQPVASTEWGIKSLVILTVICFFLQNLTTERNPFGILTGGVTDLLTLSLDHLQRWQLWRIVTYALCHADFGHLLFNMIGLWVFGRFAESVYGSRETVAFYLAAVAVSGLMEVGIRALPSETPDIAVHVSGASGGVVGLVTLGALLFPRMPMSIMFLPVQIEARWIATGFLVLDLFRVNSGSHGIASYAHLSGAFAAGAYYVFQFRFFRNRSSGQNTGGWLKGLRRRFRSRPKVKLYQPPDIDDPVQLEAVKREVDRLLDKMNREGRNSLTPDEWKYLEQASPRYQRRPGG